MLITLKQSGGFIPIKKAATREVSWTDEELEALIKVIETKSAANSPARDAQYLTLVVADRSIPIDINRIPAKYKTIFDELKEHLKIIK